MTHMHINPAGLVAAETFEDRGHNFVRIRMVDRNNGDSVDLILSQPAFISFADRLSYLSGELAGEGMRQEGSNSTRLDQ